MRLRHEFYLLLVPRDHKYGQRNWQAKTKVKVKCAKCWKKIRKPFYEQLFCMFCHIDFQGDLSTYVIFKPNMSPKNWQHNDLEAPAPCFHPTFDIKFPTPIAGHIWQRYVVTPVGGASGAAALLSCFHASFTFFWNSDFMLTWVVYVRHGCWWLSACQTIYPRKKKLRHSDMLMLGENWFPSFVGVQRTRKCWQNTVQRNTQRACECYRRSQTVTSCVCVFVYSCVCVSKC